MFGSVALFAFLLQVVTGLLMAVNYAPTPGRSLGQLALHRDASDGGQHHPRRCITGARAR